MTKIKKPDDKTLNWIATIYSYDENTGEIYGPSGERTGYIEKSQTRIFYRIDIKGKHYKRAHLAWFLYYKEWPLSQIDHYDRDSCNDKIDNLREVDDFTQQQNKDNYTGYRGFSIQPKKDGKWRKKNLVIRNQVKGVWLGYAENRKEAIEIIDKYYSEGVIPGGGSED